MQMIFQDPYASLNPRMTVGDIIAEGIDIHGLAKSKKERMDRVHELLNTVGLNKEHANRFPRILRWTTSAYRYRSSACCRPRIYHCR